MIQSPPELTNIEGTSTALRDHLGNVQSWLYAAYNILKFIDLGNVKLTSSASAPSGGQDGDLHVRVNGAATAVYLNKNGVWVAYNNP